MWWFCKMSKSIWAIYLPPCLWWCCTKKHSTQRHFLLCEMLKKTCRGITFGQFVDCFVLFGKYARQKRCSKRLSMSREWGRVVVWLLWFYLPRMPSFIGNFLRFKLSWSAWCWHIHWNHPRVHLKHLKFLILYHHILIYFNFKLH